jgi:hypothetical protein
MKLDSIRWFALALGATAMAVGCGDDTGSAGSGGTGGAGGGATTSATSSTGTGGAADGCAGLCVASGFDQGDEQDFGNGLVECLCSGGAGAVAKADCESYCAAFGVAPADSLLGMDVVESDKCACDGTSP